MDRLKEIHAEKEKGLENSRIEAGQLEADSVKIDRIETGLTETARSEAERLNTERLVAKHCGTEQIEREQTKAVIESEKKEVGPTETEQQTVKGLDAEKAYVEQLETRRLDGEKPRDGQVVTVSESVKAEQLESMRIKAERVEADEANAEAEVVLISEWPVGEADASECKLGRPVAATVPGTPFFGMDGRGDNWCTPDGVSAASPTATSFLGGKAEGCETMRVEAEQIEADEGILEDEAVLISFGPGRGTDAARCKQERPAVATFPVTPPFGTDGGGGNGCTPNGAPPTSLTKASPPGGRVLHTHAETPPLMPIPKLTVSVRELAERFSRIDGNGTESMLTTPSPLLRRQSMSAINFSPPAVAQSLEPQSAKYVPAYTTMGRFGVHGFEDFCRSEISDKAAGGLQQSENLLPIAQSFNTPRPRGNSISSAQSSSSPSLCIIQSAAPSLPSVPQSSKRRSSKNDQVSILSPQLSSSPSVCTIQSAAPSPLSVPQSSKRRSSKYDQIHNSLGRLGVHGLQVGDNAANWGARRRSWTGGS